MQKHVRDAIDWLESIGATDVVPETNNHIKVHFTWKGKRQFYVMPSSPGDERRSLRNMQADIRRELGLSGGRPKSSRRKTHRPRRRAPIGECPALTTTGDPWDVLKGSPVYQHALAHRYKTAWQRHWDAIKVRLYGTTDIVGRVS